MGGSVTRDSVVVVTGGAGLLVTVTDDVVLVAAVESEGDELVVTVADAGSSTAGPQADSPTRATAVTGRMKPRLVRFKTTPG